MELAEHALEPLRKDEEFILYRGHHRSQKDAGPPSFLLLTPVLVVFSRNVFSTTIRTTLLPLLR